MVENYSEPKEEMEQLSTEERLGIIGGTPYMITDPVLLKDLKWLIRQVRESLPSKKDIDFSKGWSEGMSVGDTKNLAYWERNMMVLYFAIHSNKSWDKFVEMHRALGSRNPDLHLPPPHGWYYHKGEGFEGWSRVISLFEGQTTFHVPDDFDLGTLRQIEPNWDGHSTSEKWERVMIQCGITKP